MTCLTRRAQETARTAPPQARRGGRSHERSPASRPNSSNIRMHQVTWMSHFSHFHAVMGYGSVAFHPDTTRRELLIDVGARYGIPSTPQRTG